MTTSGDAAVLDAVRRADVGWLSAYFDGFACPAAVLRPLLGHDDAVMRHLGVVLLRARAVREPSAELAELLPVAPDGSPETMVVLAEVYRRLRVVVPQWRAVELPARVRIAWLQAEICRQPAVAVRDEPLGEELYQAVAGVGAEDVDDVDGFVRALSGRRDPVLRAAGLRVVRTALYGALIGPEQARAYLVDLLDPVGGRLPEEVLRRLLPAYPGTLDAAARRAEEAALRAVPADTGVPGEARRRALESIGEFAERGEAGELLRIAGTDPLLLAGPMIACLGGMHRRGHFVSPDDARAVVDLALADHGVRAREVAVVLFTVRHEALRALADAPADDPGWPRRVDLLRALAEQGAPDLPVGSVLTARLAAAVRPEPFLAALRELRHTAAEEAVLATLPRAPGPALHTLEAIGGPRTVAALREGLGLGTPAGPITPYLRGVSHHALEVLWHLTDAPEQRRELLARLDPRDLPKRIASDLGAPDPHELALLTSHLDPDDPVEALCRLARNGTARTIPAITDLLLHVVSDLAASVGDDVAEPFVPGPVVEAIRALGERLYERGALRPVCLLDATDTDTAKDALVAAVALDVLDRPGVTDAELAVLLELLLRVPYRHTKARTHRLLRHRDPHVRKHVIALLARDAGRDDARALSASLIPLTAAPDPQTVRRAVLALGNAGATWAGEAIAACLDHPVMNIKKTAADALATAGTHAQVPALLAWLGRHDNPGLRASLIAAARAILGDAYAACVLAAAERADGERERELLVAALDRAVSARAVVMLAGRGSPTARPLLAAVAVGTVGLATGTVRDLAAEFAAHDIALPKPEPSEDPATRADLVALRREGRVGGDAPTVLRLARQADAPNASHLAALRAALPHVLAVARVRPEDRAAVLRLALHAAPEPWSADEHAAFADAADVLTAELGAVAGIGKVLEAVADRLPEAVAYAVVLRVRALPPQALADAPALPLLRRCGAVLTRADVDRALAAAQAGPNPWEAEVAVLREAFAPPSPPGPPSPPASPAPPAPPGEDARTWRAELGDAVRKPGAIAAFRRTAAVGVASGPSLDSRVRLDALIDAFPAADPDNRAALLDWLTDLQPIDAPAWTRAERAAALPVLPEPRTPHPDDLDQPRSAALRARLIATLAAADPDRRTAAARALLGWPEPEVRRLVLAAHLRGEVALPPHADLAHVLATMPDLADLADHDEAGRERAARLSAWLPTTDLAALTPQLLTWWERGEPATREAAFAALRHLPADLLAEALRGRLAARAWGYLDLLADRTIRRTPELTATVAHLRADGHESLADRLRLIDGPLRGPEAAARDDHALATLRARPEHATAERPSREDLLDTARTGSPEQVRRALSRLVEDRVHGRDCDPEVRAVVVDLLQHPVPRVRLHAHRASRRLFDRREYLAATEILLDDPRRDIVRSAIGTLSHARWEPALPAVVALLAHPDQLVREAAAEGLARIGQPAIAPLRNAAAHARPDRRARYTAVLDRIVEAGAP
ncbi:HEAT repeat domain-containing protein [Embleya sp. NBC_00896]|uniref:HEAT repeat domain-containing protein n=1 Tax=Embleya sp. NBC_00896 TaxID=2975961 RepID=UPI00386AB77E|nr:HEAT repeat domain-containing protein [Embleya sp. NBC_00896]